MTLLAISLMSTTLWAAAAPPPSDQPAGNPPPAAQARPGTFDQWDRNGDGVISREEFDAVRGQRARVARPDAAAATPERSAAPRPARPGAGPREGGQGPEIERRVGEIVNDRMREMHQTIAERLRAMVREEVDRALKDRVPPREARRDARPGPGGPPVGDRPLAGPRRGERAPDDMKGAPPAKGAEPPKAGPPEARRGRFEQDQRAGGDRPIRRRLGIDRAPRDGRSDDGQKKDGARDRPRRGRGAPSDRPEPGRMLERWDANRDGVISRDEFPGAPQRFDRIDANGDGKIDRAELKALRDRIEAQPRDGEDRPARPTPPRGPRAADGGKAR